MKTFLDIIKELRRLTQNGVLVWEKADDYGATVTVEGVRFFLEIPYYSSFSINGYPVDFTLLQSIKEIPLLAADIQHQLSNKENGESFTVIWNLLQRIEQEHTQSH